VLRITEDSSLEKPGFNMAIFDDPPFYRLGKHPKHKLLGESTHFLEYHKNPTIMELEGKSHKKSSICKSSKKIPIDILASTVENL